jgi:hypothetical protein
MLRPHGALARRYQGALIAFHLLYTTDFGRAASQLSTSIPRLSNQFHQATQLTRSSALARLYGPQSRVDGKPKVMDRRPRIMESVMSLASTFATPLLTTFSRHLLRRYLNNILLVAILFERLEQQFAPRFSSWAMPSSMDAACRQSLVTL